jgi:hypothetical protein
MISVTSNVDQSTLRLIDTGFMNKDLSDICDEKLGIIFVARDRFFFNEAWRSKGKTYMRVVLPYEEVLHSKNVELLAYQHLYELLDQVNWMDKESIKAKLLEKIRRLEEGNSQQYDS